MTRHSKYVKTTKLMVNFLYMKDIEKFNLPPISHYPSRKEWENACWNEILKSKKIIKTLTTSYERHNLVMRVAVITGINLGKKYKQIAEELWLSPQTISGIKKTLKENGYKSYRERSKKERKKKVYSSDPATKQKEKDYGRFVRTKYGKIRLHF